MASDVRVRPARPTLSVAERAPTGFVVGAGAVLVVVSSFAGSAVPASAADVRLGLVAVTLGAFGALTVDAVAVAAVAVLAFLVFDGFLVNRFGEVSWHGAADGRRLGVLAIAALVGFVAGTFWRALRTWRIWYWRSAWLAEQARDLQARDLQSQDSAGPLDEQSLRRAALVPDEEEMRRG